MTFERAVQDEVGARERGRRSRGTPIRAAARTSRRARCTTPSSNGAALVGDVEHRRHAVLDERAPDRVVVGMRERPAVDERGRDHRELHAVALEPRELGARASAASRSVTCATGCTRPRAVGRDRSAPTVPRGHVRGERGRGRRRACAPTAARSSGTRPPRRRPSSASRSARARRVPVVARQLVVVARLGAAGRRGCVRAGRRARDVWPGTLHVDRAELAVAPRQPRVAELVVDDPQRVVAVRGIDVVEPRRARLVEVLVGVDHGSVTGRIVPLT